MARYSIPPELYSSLVPAADLSVLQLIKYCLPLVLPSFPLTTTKDFFNPLPEGPVHIATIQDVPSPPLPIVQALQKDPLWIVTYWMEMFAVRQARDTWMVAEDNLRKMSQLWKAKGKSESLKVIDQCRAALSCISRING